MLPKQQENYDLGFADEVLELDLSPSALEEVVLRVKEIKGIEEFGATTTYRSHEDISETLKRVCSVTKKQVKKKIGSPKKFKKYAKRAIVSLASLAVVGAIGYGISRIHSVRAMYDRDYVLKYEKELEAQKKYKEQEQYKKSIVRRLERSANFDCMEDVSTTEFSFFYEKATGKKLPTKLYGRRRVVFSIDDSLKTIEIKWVQELANKRVYAYNVTLSAALAEKYINKIGNPCSIKVEQ